MRAKTKTKIGMISTLTLMFLLLFSVPNVHAGVCQENPNPPNSVWVCDIQIIHQDSYPVANDLHFRAHIYEPEEWGWKVLGYRVTITCFPNVECVRTKKPSPFGSGLWCQGIDVDASGADVDYCEWCVIITEFWLNLWNDIRIQDKIWTYEEEEAKIAPDRGWRVEPVCGGDIVTIYNDDDTDSFTISGFEYHVDEEFYPDPRQVEFDMAIPGNFTLPPGANKEFSAPNDISDGYVYFHYKARNGIGEVIEEIYAGHEMEEVVGGFSIPVDKLALLAPYIALAVAAVAVTIGAVSARKRWLGNAAVPKP